MAQIVMFSVQVRGVWPARLAVWCAAPIIRQVARFSPAISIFMIQGMTGLIRKLIRVRAF
jgi:hypothetical protein